MDELPIQREMIGAVLGGRYRVASRIGAGGMGEVFLAHDTVLERRVAIKLLPPDAETDAMARERLRREAMAAAALDHPFICKVFEIGNEDGRLFVVMEYVDGDTLHALARRTLLPIRQIVDIASELAEALEEAHRRSFVHRDLKPANVMVTRQGHVKVMDFGLAKQVAVVADSGKRSSAETALTESGTRLGTPAYMSPEQVLGGALDARSDIFSFGVILHELVTGTHPFLRAGASDTMAAILRDPPTPGSRDAESLSGFGAVIHRMLAKACAERHQTMGEVRTELEALLERARASTATSVAVAAQAQPAERTPFVGRNAEAAELTRLLDRMLTGQGGFALIGGEPGVGKTRLARELMQHARERGCLSLTGHCYEMEGAPPFVPFIEMFEQSVRTVPQAVRASLGDLAPEIASIVPSLRRTFPDIAPLADVPADQRRRLVFGAYVEYIRRASQKSPIVALFDDLHWADESTLQLLLHSAPNLAAIRILVVGTYRDVELDVKRPFAKTLEALLRQRLATRISLRRLGESGVQQMLAAMSGSTPPSGLAKAVFRETEGNPFFVEEVYQHLAEEGKLFDETGAWKTGLKVDAIEVPEGVRLVIGRRLDRLGDEARKVLTAGAIIGRSFPVDLLQAIVDVSEDGVLDALDEAERAQLVASQASQRTARYEFVHELIRTTLVNGLSLPRRQRLHLKIADALERLRAASLDSHASALAHHLYQAGAAVEATRAAKYLALAGRRSIAAGAFEEGLEAFDQLVSLDLPEDDPLVAEAFERRGNALIGLQRPDDAIAALERAMALSIARHDDAAIGRVATAAANSFIWRARSPDALVLLRRGLNALSDEGVRERASLQCFFAVTHISLGHVDEAWRDIDAAVATAERLAEPSLLGRALMAKGACHRLCSEFEASVDAARRAQPLCRESGLEERANLLVNHVLSACTIGRFSEGDALMPELEATAQRAGHHGALWAHERVRHGRGLEVTGDLRAFLSHSEVALRSTYLPYSNKMLVGAARLYLGERDGALEQLREAVAEQPPAHFLKGLPEANLFAGTALAGDVDRARPLFPAVEPWLPLPSSRNIMGAWLALEASVLGLALVGDTERAGALYAATVANIATGAVCNRVLVVGPVTPQLAAAVAADAAGLADKAREHFDVALRQARDVPIRIQQPAVLFWYGRMLSEVADAADQARGRAMIDAALADFRALGMVPHARLAEQFLRGRPTERGFGPR